LQEAKYYSAYS